MPDSACMIVQALSGINNSPFYTLPNTGCITLYR